MYQRIALSCHCGRRPTRLREIGLTSDRQLVIYWQCSQCRKHVYVVRPLADYWRECPSPDYDSERKATYVSEDERFLQRLGIRLPEDEEARP
jgi:hypothetical protein